MPPDAFPAAHDDRREISLPEIGTLLIRINQFSQGEKTLVEQMILLAVQERPDWLFPAIGVDGVMAALRKRIVAIVQNPMLHRNSIDLVSIETELEAQISFMQIAMEKAGAGQLDKDERHFDLQHAFLSILEREWHYLCSEGRRPRRGPQRDTIMHDAHASYVLHYVERGHTTGHPVLDRMTAEMRRLLHEEAAWLDPELLHRARALLADIIPTYNAHHQEDPWVSA